MECDGDVYFFAIGVLCVGWFESDNDAILTRSNGNPYGWNKMGKAVETCIFIQLHLIISEKYV